MTLTDEQRLRISAWMQLGVKTAGSRPIEDLHLDAIDSAWRQKGEWFRGGFAAFRFAVSNRDEMRFSASVVLVMSLSSATDPLGMDFSSADSLQERLDWSPPALYLVRDEEFARFYGKQEAEAIGTELTTIFVPLGILGEALPARECRLLEFKSKGDIEYSRALHVIG